MRLKILVLGDNPVSLISDCQLLRDRGLLVFTAFNMQNIKELATEIQPDILFFDLHTSNPVFTAAYNEVMNNEELAHIPVIYTLTDDDVYLVTRKRTKNAEQRRIISDNIIDAIKMALRTNKSHRTTKKTYQIPSIMQMPLFPARA